MYKVMIADDEPIVRQGLIHLINWQEVDCELMYAASDGQDLLDNLEKYNPDIIICDIKMPRLDGIQVAKYIWENRLMSKLILLTAYADFSFAQSAVKYGVVQYVTKTGALIGIIEAIHKCKAMLQREQSKYHPVDSDQNKINFLKSIIDSSLFDQDEIIKLQLQHQVKLSNFYALNLKLQLSSDSSKEQTQKHMSLSNFLSIALSDYTSFIIPVAKDHFCIIINEITQSPLSKIQSICKEIIVSVENLLNETVYIGISSSANDVLSLHEAYHQASTALSYRFLDEHSKIYIYSPVNNSNYHNKQLDLLLDQIELEIQKGNTEAAMLAVEQLLTTLKSTQQQVSDIKNIGLVISNQCKKHIATYNEMTSSTNDLLTHHTNLIVDSALFSEYASSLREIVSFTANNIHTVLKRKNNIIIEAMHYIQANFDKNISLNDIASHINVNSSYLSRLFKEKTGDTIINTINTLKIEKAKNCLINTNMKIYEISQSIGIDDTTYFSHFFKKHTNMSPKQYKELHNSPS